jgi:hypothetical protein
MGLVVDMSNTARRPAAPGSAPASDPRGDPSLWAGPPIEAARTKLADPLHQTAQRRPHVITALDSSNSRPAFAGARRQAAAVCCEGWNLPAGSRDRGA